MCQLTWAEGRQQLSSGEILDGPLDVCEVGTTWVTALAERRVLRPFTQRDAMSMGGAGAFVEGALRICSHNDALWAMPWQLDTRLIWYWRDALTAAGVREQSAFDSPDHIAETLAAIDRSGRPAWVSAMDADIVTLQNAASWVWYGNGDFLAHSGRAVAFDRAEALAALKSFFGLALWGQGAHVEESLQLVRFLKCPEAQLRLAQLGNLLPARLAILTDPKLNADPCFHGLSSNVARGRSLPRGEPWAVIEWQLSAALGSVWQDVLTTPQPDLDEILARHLQPLARQLNVTLAA